MVLIGAGDDALFWSLMFHLGDFKTETIAVKNGNEMIAELGNRISVNEVIFISIDRADEELVRCMQRSGQERESRIITVTSLADHALESAVREAGIFYYMTVPNEIQRVRKIAMCALRTNEKTV